MNTGIHTKRPKAFMEDVDDFVMDELIKGTLPVNIIKILRKDWGYKTDSNARAAIYRVSSRMQVTDDAEIATKISIYKAMYLDRYKTLVSGSALPGSDNRGAVIVLDSLVKLEGLVKDKPTADFSGTIKLVFE